MICYDGCDEWFHGECVNIAEVEGMFSFFYLILHRIKFNFSLPSLFRLMSYLLLGVDYESILWYCPSCEKILKEKLRQCQMKNFQLHKDCWDAL